MAKQQRRGLKIAMSKEQLDEYLATERTCRVGTVSADGPHVTPLWFVWDGNALWLNSIVKSQRWTDLMRDSRVAIIIDGGHDYNELHGVEIKGRVETVGDVPRMGEPLDEVATPELLFARKYGGTDQMFHDGRHAWLRIVPEKISSWDFRKL